MSAVEQGNYAELTRLVRHEGLLTRQPAYYARNIVVTFLLLFASLTIIITVEKFWLQILNAFFLAFVYGQLSFLGHDAGHKQIFASFRRNDIFGLLISFKLGMSRTWWVDKHNRHHSYPNQVGLDPDIDIPVLSFTAKDALGKRRILRPLIKRQAWFLPIMLCFVCVTLRLAGVQYMLSGKQLKYSLLEPLLMLLHFVIYFSFLFWFLDAWQAVLFVAVHQLAFGFYMGSVFATNHKSMPILDSDGNEDFLTDQILTSMPILDSDGNEDFLMNQIFTARDVTGNVVIDFIYGGLNYQIEHHLFPQMSRNKLREAQGIVKKYCADHGIAYYETDFVRSYKEILQYFHRVSSVLRKPVVIS